MRHHQQIHFTRLAKAKIVKSCSGFSAIELVIVIAIAGLLFAIAAANFETMVYGSTINRAIVELTSELQLARMKAIASHQSVTVSFNDPATDQYTVSWTDAETLVTSTKTTQLDPGGSRISFDSSPPGGATSDGSFAFNSLGFIQPDLGGTIGNIYLVDNINGRRIGIAVTVSGAIEEQQWSGSSWSGPVFSYTP